MVWRLEGKLRGGWLCMCLCGCAVQARVRCVGDVTVRKKSYHHVAERVDVCVLGLLRVWFWQWQYAHRSR